MSDPMMSGIPDAILAGITADYDQHQTAANEIIDDLLDIYHPSQNMLGDMGATASAVLAIQKGFRLSAVTEGEGGDHQCRGLHPIVGEMFAFAIQRIAMLQRASQPDNAAAEPSIRDVIADLEKQLNTEGGEQQ